MVAGRQRERQRGKLAVCDYRVGVPSVSCPRTYVRKSKDPEMTELTSNLQRDPLQIPKEKKWTWDLFFFSFHVFLSHLLLDSTKKCKKILVRSID